MNQITAQREQEDCFFVVGCEREQVPLTSRCLRDGCAVNFWPKRIDGIARALSEL